MQSGDRHSSLHSSTELKSSSISATNAAGHVRPSITTFPSTLHINTSLAFPLVDDILLSHHHQRKLPISSPTSTYTNQPTNRPSSTPTPSIMKFLATSVMALAATAFAAPVEQNEERAIEARKDTQTGPFYLKVRGTGENPSIDGYLGGFHAGAAIQLQGYVTELPANKNNRYSYEYYFNASSNAAKVGGQPTGNLIWKLPYNDNQFADTVARLVYSPGSNVAAVVTEPNNANYADNGFGPKGQLFTPIYYDDSDNAPGQWPAPENPTQGKNWVLCWQSYGSYYYRSLGWAQSFPTTNPTCRPVTVTQEFP